MNPIMETEFRLAKHLRKVLHLDCENNMEWISVKDRMPEEGKDVLLYGKLEHQEDFDIHKAVFHKDVDVNDEINKKRYSESQFWEADWGYDFDKVTHWMPLPKPPEEK